MNYAEVIENNCQTVTYGNWWPRFAFHYTDVTNAIGILKEGMLYSRFDATNRRLMSNDNASRQVIDMTFSGTASYVRFYFRPLTPTQFHNEGYKHTGLRYCSDDNANVPVPVFFLFDLETVLSMKETRFSEQSLAGGGSELHRGPEEFAKLNFSQIYKSGFMDDAELEKKYRHAEIIYPDQFPIDEALRKIVCRNDIERMTLLNLLRKNAPKAYSKYQNMIEVRTDCYEHNGLYVTRCNYFEDKAAVVFSKTANKEYYTRKYKQQPNDRLLLKAEAEFEWMHSDKLINRQVCGFTIDYEETENVVFSKLSKPSGATALHMRIKIENKLICYMCWQLAEAALL